MKKDPPSLRLRWAKEEVIFKVILSAHKYAKRLTTNAKRAFTLIELLIVIAIIGILAAAVLVAINPAKRQNQAKDANIKSDIGSIATALQAYYTSPGAGAYPDGDAAPNDGGLAKLVENQDLKSIPVPPAGGTGGAAYVFAAVDSAGGACDNQAAPTADPCTEVSVSYPMFETTTLVWCWKSVNGKAAAITAAICATPLTNP